MENNTIEKHNVAPYLSVLLGAKSTKEEMCSVHEIITQILADESSDEMSIGSTIVDDVGELGTVKITSYTIAKSPSWAKGIDLKDLEHHVFVSFNVRDHLAFYFSEKGKKDTIREFFGKKRLPNLFPIPISKLNGNFINEDEIKMLWLSGIHGRDNFKADSKVLGGKSVADTLDPLIDQSYMMSAVRTEIWGTKSKTSVGINPFKLSIWRGPCKDWPTFENRVLEILDILSVNSSESDSPIGILSYPISQPNELERPYDFSLVDYDFLPEEDGQHRKELLKKLQYDFHAELTHSFIDSDISLNIFHKGNEVGHICVEVEVDDYKVNFKIKSEAPGVKKHFEQYKRVFIYPELVKCWFESGHAVVNGMVFRTGYQDVEYNKFLWADFEQYDITKEKPGNNPQKPALKDIGKEKSLFCWVQKCWSGNWLTPNEFNTTENPKGWLYCDDGAGEKADFIHYVKHDTLHLISLIHVKASKSSENSRKISVGAHDVVLNQAIKNLRYTSRKVLVEDLKVRHDNAAHKGCWHDGKSANPEDFFNELLALKDNKHIKTRVVVVQPHTQKSTYEKNIGSKIKTQLDVLLVSAENAIRSSGADFHIIGFADKKI
ncbi:hypothetical protein PVK64_11320 [Aliivibrio sp. S4TY2]|uniref:hypothetical protein n=1 Tax=unclassified Aliivibrio TaxID=2645654 RepID=UPI0023790AC6|nr:MULTISPECIES: hypothetical protein [unclassified Aliivibrio]MDD9156764.1 hypothetical protein [Aliivibrio sp. S4TY2]MDD9160250.1 hypothetical protein [Aliivibrio sp. S4TY1]MDD9164457.1 hypothetical protein [Aliivibrio sp. S4MY2]MDD9168673.1 hypothetical protein [Aliivibrio sp. S4MY4]MDD9184792.1 hypothetical protein [Aliivibrio sp. S4MY3]